jgi:hypothetical protein
MTHLFALSAFVTFVYVFLRAFQQLNVVNGHYWRVPMTSVAMGIGDVLLVVFIVKSDTLWIGVTNGIGGALGCMLAMYVSSKWRKG